MCVLIWGYCQQNLVKLSNFRFICSLVKENIETKFAEKKKTFTIFLLYFISFSVVYSFESRARRPILVNVSQNASWFPCILMFTAHFVAYLWSLPELLRRGRTTHDHQGRQSNEVPLFLLVLVIPRGWGLGLGVGKEEVAKPQIKNWQIFLQLQNLLFLI